MATKHTPNKGIIGGFNDPQQIRSRSLDIGHGYLNPLADDVRGFSMDSDDDLQNTVLSRKGSLDAEKVKRKGSRGFTQPTGTLPYTASNRDSLDRIAAHYNTTPSELMRLNRLATRMIYPGQELYVPDPDAPKPVTLSPVSSFQEIVQEEIDQTVTKSPDPLVSVTERPKDIPVIRMKEKPEKSVPRDSTPPRQPGSRRDFPLIRSKSAPKPGRVIRQKQVSIESPVETEYFEKFLKINVKYITDGQGVVSGVLLVTPNAIMFDPNVSDSLVIENGADMYGIITPMDMVVSAAMYHDITPMTRKDCNLEVYHSQNCPLARKKKKLEDGVESQPSEKSPENGVEEEVFTESCDSVNANDKEEEEEEVFWDKCSCGARSKQEEGKVTENGITEEVDGKKDNDVVVDDDELLKEIDSELKSEDKEDVENVPMEDKNVDTSNPVLDSVKSTEKESDVTEMNVSETAPTCCDMETEGQAESEPAKGTEILNVNTDKDVESLDLPDSSSLDKGSVESGIAEMNDTVMTDEQSDVVTETGHVIRQDFTPDKSVHHEREELPAEETGSPQSELTSDKTLSPQSTEFTPEKTDMPQTGEFLPDETETPQLEDFTCDEPVSVPSSELIPEERDIAEAVRGSEQNVSEALDEMKGEESAGDPGVIQAEIHDNVDETDTGGQNKEENPIVETTQNSQLLKDELKEEDDDEAHVKEKSDQDQEVVNPSADTDLQTDDKLIDGVETENDKGEKQDSHEPQETVDGQNESEEGRGRTRSFVDFSSGLFAKEQDPKSPIPDITEVIRDTSATMQEIERIKACARRIRITPRNRQKSDSEYELERKERARKQLERLASWDTNYQAKSLQRELLLRPKPMDEPPLYLCLKVGKPMKKTFSTTGAMEAYNSKYKKPEYWFAVPRDRADHLYAFFVQWSPNIYGKEEPEAKELGFVVLEEEDAPMEIVEDFFNDPVSKDWEIVTYEEAKRRLSLLDGEDLPLPELLNKSHVIDNEQVSKLMTELPPRVEGYCWSLIYSTYEHGFSLKTLYRSMDSYDSPVLLILKDSDNYIFGALLSTPVKVSDHFYGTGETFLYTLLPEFKKYNWSGDNNFFVKGDFDSLAIGGGDGNFGLWVDGGIYHGSSHPCQTFNNECLSAKEDFVIQGLEAWGFV